MPPGWYYAEGDPPGTNRYWDGETWQGGPQPVVQPAAGFSPGMTGGFGQAYAESSQALLALLLSLAALLCCGLLWPVAWKLGHDEIVAIDAGRRDPNNRGTANAGRIIGMIGTGLLVLVVVVWIIAVLAAL